MLKSNKGITLIALVITKARQSEVMNKRGEVADKINLALQELMTNLTRDTVLSEDGSIDFNITDPEIYSIIELLGHNDMSNDEGYYIYDPLSEQDAYKNNSKEAKIYAFIISWNPVEYDQSGRYGGENDFIWGAITYDEKTTDKVLFKADCPAKANMSQASTNDFASPGGKYCVGAFVEPKGT